MTELFGIGFFAGLALAIPVGPMALLLIQTTLKNGLRVGLVSGLGMASVDWGYALLVFLVGGAISSFLSQWGQVLTWLGSSVLIVLGVLTVRSNWKSSPITESASTTETDSATRSYLKFVAATVVNPPTALYFLALAATLGSKADFSSMSASQVALSAAAFSVGVFIGSGLWQESLAVGSSFLRSHLSPAVRRWIGIASGLLIVGLALRMALVN